MRLWAKRLESRARWIRSGLYGLLLAMAGAPAAFCADALPPVSVAAYGAEIAAARRAVQACAATAASCDAGKLPPRQQVQDGGGGAFETNWQWLQEALNSAKTASGADRARAMRAADLHLAELATEAGMASPDGTAQFTRARAAANAALAREEFRASTGPDWVERQFAKIQDWILRLFTGMDRLGKRAPWLAPAIEWSCFALALAGLLWFVRQSLTRQALRISLSEGAALVGNGDRDSADWARLAEERAAAQDWREAIHCLYWAAIALMEGRRAWKPNATRTPREYLKLLRPGSEGHLALRELTRIFERIWYGHAVAQAPQYEAALRAFQALETARPERVDPFGQGTTAQPLTTAGGV